MLVVALKLDVESRLGRPHSPEKASQAFGHGF